MTGIPVPHSSDEEEDPIIPGPKESFTLPEVSEWEQVPGKPGLWRNKQTGKLTYIPPMFGVPQRPS